MAISNNLPQIKFISEDNTSKISDLNFKNIRFHPKLHFTSLFTGDEMEFIEYKIADYFKAIETPSYSAKYFCVTIKKKYKKHKENIERYLKAEKSGDNLVVQIVPKDLINNPVQLVNDELHAKIVESIEHNHKTTQTATLPFYIRMTNYFEDNKITKKQFAEYGMKEKYYRQCKYPKYTPSMGKFVAIAIVCDMPLVLVIDLLASLGSKFDANNKLHTAYIYLINNHHELYTYFDKSHLLEECDKILMAMGYFGIKELLSEVPRKEKATQCAQRKTKKHQ